MAGAITLTYMVGVGGAQQGTAQIQGLTGAMRSSRAAIGKPLDMGGWLRPLAGVRNSLAGIGRMATGVLGGMGLTFGVAGLAKLVKESSTFREDLVSLQAALKLTDEETASIGRRMEELAVATGRSRTELLAAARAGTDFGLSIAEATDTMADLDAMARMMKVAPEVLMKGMGGLRKLAGPDMASADLRTLMAEGQAASAMPEDAFLELVSKMAPQLSGVKGLEGQGGVAFLMAQIASLGETFATQPKLLKSGIQTMIDSVRDPKNAETFKKLGVRTGDLALAQQDLLAAVIGQKKGWKDIDPALLDFLMRITASEGALGRLEGAQDSLTGDLTAQGAELQKHLDAIKNEPSWDKLMERFKQPLLNAADSVFSALMEWVPRIVEGFGSFLSAMQSAGESLGAALARVLGIDTASQVAEAETEGRSDADKLAAAGFYTAQTPEERAAALRRAGPGVGQGTGSETFFDRAEAMGARIEADRQQGGSWRDRWSDSAEQASGTTAESLEQRVLRMQRERFQQAAAQVNIYVDGKVEAGATVRAESSNPGTTVTVNGAPAP